MGFSEKYLHALLTSDLRDDEQHYQPEALQASAYADKVARDIGSLLHRVKFSGTISQKLAKALIERERFEQLLADAEHRKDQRKAAEYRRELDSGLCACTVTGGEAESFRTLARAWLVIVAEKGAARHWIKPADVPMIGHLAPAMYKRVAEASLAHYLDGKCPACRGAKVDSDRRVCGACAGTGEAKILGMSDFERRRVQDMLSELMMLESSHSGAASALLRREV